MAKKDTVGEVTPLTRLRKACNAMPECEEKLSHGEPTFFVRKSVLDKHGYFDLQYTIASDVEFTMRLLEARRVATRYIPRVLVRMRTGGASNHSISSVWRQNVEIWRAMQTHGLRPSPVRFVVGKLMSRARQFLSRHRAA